MIGRQLAEDQPDRGHILQAMIAVGGIVQRPRLVDDANRRFLRCDGDCFNVVQAILDLAV